jgi:hypothetical protein
MPVISKAALAAPPLGQEHAPRRTPWHPFHVLYPVAALAAILLSRGPVADPDVYWHVRIGGDILRRHAVAGAGSGWSLVPPHGTWISSEWLAEVVLHDFVSWFGWQGMLVYQGIVVAALLVAVAISVRPGRDPRRRALIYAVTVISLAPFFQARPQTLSLVMLAWLGLTCRTVLLERRLPRAWVFLPLVLLWAQIHGLWLFAPAFLLLAALAGLLDSRTTSDLRLVGKAGLLSVAGLAIGCLNPVGIRSLTLPFTLRSATATISEWQPTTIIPYFSWGLLMLIGLLVLAWVRGGRRVTNGEMAWTAALALFAFLAYRNVPVAVLLLAPVVAVRLTREMPAASSTRSEQRLLVTATAVMALLALATDAVMSATGTAIPLTAPTRLAAMLNDGTEHRVIDDYNTGGVILAFGGSTVKVGVDGRADYYGGAYIKRYEDMLAMRSGWSRLFNQLAPDAALINRHGPLVQWLTDDGWRQVATQGNYVLLRSGTASG